MSKKAVIFAITLLMLASLGSTFISKANAVKPNQTVQKSNAKADNDRETDDDRISNKESAKIDNDTEINDDCDKYEQESKDEKISKKSCEENEDSDNEQNDNDSDD